MLFFSTSQLCKVGLQVVTNVHNCCLYYFALHLCCVAVMGHYTMAFKQHNNKL